MKGVNFYIIQLENPFHTSFKTEKGNEIFANEDFSMDRLSNRVAKVVATPERLDHPIKTGYEVLIDPSNFFRQIYRGVKQSFQNEVDAEKGLFYLNPDLVVCYREKPTDEWVPFEDNNLVEPILEVKPKQSPLDVIEKKEFKGKVKTVLPSLFSKSQGVSKNDTLFIDTVAGGLKFWLNGKEYLIVKNRHIYAKVG